MSSIERFAAEKLSGLEKRALRRRLATTGPADRAAAVRDGRRLVNFCSNDYLGLTRHPGVMEAARQAGAEYGAGAGASRLVSGNHPPYAALEGRIARFKEAEAACVFGSGYLANIGVIPCFATPEDLILADERCHASMLAGAKLSGAGTRLYRHNDMDHLRDELRAHRGAHRHCLILSEGVFGMDGDLAPLPEIASLAGEFDAWPYIDDAHALGVIGGMRGSAFAFAEKPDIPKIDIPLQMGTLSKAVGAYGGYVCGAEPVIDFIKTRARSLIYSTGLPAGTVAAALAALEVMDFDRSLGDKVIAKARRFAGPLGLAEPQSAIVPLILGTPEAALQASNDLEERGFLVTAIRPPTVAEGTARLRITFSLAHRDEDVDALAAACADLGLQDRAA